MKYNIHINEEAIDLKKEDIANLNLIELPNDQFHLLQDNQSFDIKLLHANHAAKTMTLEVNGEKFELKIADEYDQLVEKMGLGISSDQKLTDIKAPMPGLILDVLVKPGQTISKGDQLLILEAMKMENVLKAAGDGVVKSIAISKGDAVDKGQVMIEME